MTKKVMIGVGLVVAIGLGAFYSLGGMSWLDAQGFRGQDRLVRARVEGYWQARVDGDVDKIASYAHPDQSGAFDPGILVTESYEIRSLEVDGDNAVRPRSRVHDALEVDRRRQDETVVVVGVVPDQVDAARRARAETRPAIGAEVRPQQRICLPVRRVGGGALLGRPVEDVHGDDGVDAALLDEAGEVVEAQPAVPPRLQRLVDRLDA